MRHLEHVFHDDAAGDAHVLGVGTVVEEKIFAEIFLATAAVKAAQAGRGICSDNTQAQAPPGVDSLPHRGDFADDFVAENRGRLDHLGVIAALPDFEVGAIGEREAHAQQDFVGGQRRNIDFFQAQVLAAVQHGGHHLCGHRGSAHYCRGFFADTFRPLGSGCSHECVIKILSD